MFKTLRGLFDSFAAHEPTAAEREDAVRLATAVLLVEVMRADTQLEHTEYRAVEAALQRTFAVSGEALAQLMERAQQSAKVAYDYHRFSSDINAHFTHPQKILIVEAMWQVAYADTRLDTHENHVIAKVAGLLHVTHGEYIAAKMRAKEAAQLP